MVLSRVGIFFLLSCPESATAESENPGRHVDRGFQRSVRVLVGTTVIGSPPPEYLTLLRYARAILCERTQTLEKNAPAGLDRGQGEVSLEGFFRVLQPTCR